MAGQYDNLYDPNSNSFRNQTKPMDQVIRNAVEVMLYEMHTCFPVQVVKVRSNAYVDVQPLLLTQFMNETQPRKMPVVQNVPVIQPRGALYWIKLPIAVNDLGVCIVSQRSLDTWKAGTGTFANPNDVRQHNLSDCIFIPGLYTTQNVVPGAATDLTLHNGDSTITMRQDGKFAIENTDSELLSLISDLADATASLADAVASGFTALQSLLGPGSLAPQIAQATLAQASADTIKSDVEDMTA